MRGGVVLSGVAVLALLAPGAAHAGRSFFGWLAGTEVMPERSVELQNWTSEENVLEARGDRSETTWGVGPFIGITDQLELFLPLEIIWARTPGAPGSTQLHNYGAEVRYRFVTMDPEDAPAFAPMLRVSAKRLVLDREVMRSEVGLVATYEAGSVVVAADVAARAEVSRDDQVFTGHAGAGISVNVVGDLRAGAEVFSRLAADGDGGTSAAVGPNLSWTHGRFWVSAAYAIGVYQIKTAPRLQWGIAF